MNVCLGKSIPKQQSGAREDKGIVKSCQGQVCTVESRLCLRAQVGVGSVS